MALISSFFLIKLLNLIPHSLLVRIGYSRLGSKFVKSIRNREAKTWYEIDDGIKIHLDLANPHTWDLIQGKDPEKNIKKVFLNNIKKGDTIIDAGANIGEFSIIAAKKIGTDGNLISIEPLKQTSKWLQKNLLLNNFHNHVVLESAVGRKTEVRTLFKKNESAGMGLLDPVIDGEKLVESSKINVKTVDDILSSRKINQVNMLKIDVEGFEYDVLLGCKKSFEDKKIEKIICEIHLGYLSEKGIDENLIYSLLEKNGFNISTIEFKNNTKHILACHT